VGEFGDPEAHDVATMRGAPLDETRADVVEPAPPTCRHDSTPLHLSPKK
jgi:hypothetical protein